MFFMAAAVHHCDEKCFWTKGRPPGQQMTWSSVSAKVKLVDMKLC